MANDVVGRASACVQEILFFYGWLKFEYCLLASLHVHDKSYEPISFILTSIPSNFEECGHHTMHSAAPNYVATYSNDESDA